LQQPFGQHAAKESSEQIFWSFIVAVLLLLLLYQDGLDLWV
jgi:hypothetical protein